MGPGAAAFDERIAAHYEAWYDAPEGRRADALEKASLRRLLESFPGASSILEVGCGTGHFTRWLNEQGLAAVGLDLSAAMLAQARTLDDTLLVRGDVCRLPFADGTFDLVALITTLEFLERPREALAEALRVTQRGLILGVLNRRSLLGLQRRLAGLLRPTVYHAAHMYSVGEVRRLLRSVVGDGARIVWHTTPFPGVWPWEQANLPWGGFIAMALLPAEGRRSRKVKWPVDEQEKGEACVQVNLPADEPVTVAKVSVHDPEGQWRSSGSSPARGT